MQTEALQWQSCILPGLTGGLDTSITTKIQTTMRASMTKTNETFITSNGTVVRYESILAGIRATVEVCGRGLMSESELDDIYMDAAFKALTTCKDYDPKRSKPETYGAMIAYSCLMDALKKASRRGATFTSLKSDDESGTDFPYPLWGYRGDEFESDRDLCSGEAKAYIFNAINRLPENYREVIILTARGCKPADIAENLRCKPEDVYRWLNRARTALEKNLGGSYLREHGICA